MSEQKDDEIAAQIRGLVAKLPPAALHALMAEFDERKVRDNAHGQVLRRALIDHMNQRRPHRAQRLFMSIVEPLLVNDPVMLRCQLAVPGLLQRIDIAAVWHFLSEQAFPDLAREVQDRLDEMAREQPIERVLASPMAVALRNRLRDRAIEVLSDVLRSRRRTAEVLEEINAQALSDAKARAPGLEEKTKLESSYLRLLVMIFSNDDLIVSTVNDLLARFAAPTKDEADAQLRLQLMSETLDELAETLPPVEEPQRTVLQAMPLLALVNTAHQYEFVQRYIATSGGEPTRPMRLALAALTGHFEGCAWTIAGLMTFVLHQASLETRGQISIPQQSRLDLDNALDRLVRVLKAMIEGGLFEDKELEQRYRYAMSEVSILIGDGIARAAMERVRELVKVQKGPAADDGDVYWALSFIHRWERRMRAIGLTVDNLQDFQRAVKIEVRNSYNAILRSPADIDTPEKFAALTRLELVLRCFDESILELLTTVSKSLQTLMLWALDRSRMRQIDVDLIRIYIGLMQAEMKQNRGWTSPEMTAILAAYDRRLAAGWILEDAPIEPAGAKA